MHLSKKISLGAHYTRRQSNLLQELSLICSEIRCIPLKDLAEANTSSSNINPYFLRAEILCSCIQSTIKVLGGIDLNGRTGLRERGGG